MKVNLTIDGNYLLNKDVFILHSMKTLYLDLEKLLKRDIERLIKMQPFDNVYFLSDSKMRWRKEYYPEYKGNRKPDSNIDWEFVYKTYDKVKADLLEHNRIHMHEIDRLEGDDLIAHIVTESNKKGYSNVIIASDGDLHQLLTFDIGLEYINMMYNYKLSDERTYWPENSNVFFSEMDNSTPTSMFDMNDDMDFLLYLGEMMEKTKSIEVNKEASLLCKLVSGDKKDNIPSAFIKLTKTGKEMGIGKAGGETIYKAYKEAYPEEIDFDDDGIFITRLTDVISTCKKVVDDSLFEGIKNNINRNRVLIRLDNKYLPEDLKNNMFNSITI